MKCKTAHFNKRLMEINPRGIDIGRNAPLRVRRHLPGERASNKNDKLLLDSVAELGLLHPPALLQADNNEPEDGMVIFGHRRIAAAAESGLKNINVLVFSCPENKINEIIALRLEELYSGTALSELEKIITIKKIIDFSGSPAEEMIPLLSKIYGRRLSNNYLARLLNLLGSENDVLETLHGGDISTGDLMALSQHPDVDLPKTVSLLAGEHLNRGKQKEAVRLILYLADQSKEKWDRFLSVFHQGDNLVESLHKACYPSLRSDLENISAIIDDIGLPKDAVITPPLNLEGGYYTLRVKIRDKNSFSGILAKLDKFSKEKGILKLLEILKGKKL